MEKFDLQNYYENSFAKGYRATGRKPIQTYEDNRQHHERQTGTHDPGALGIDGWKRMKWAGLLWMYRNGKLTLEKAERIREVIAPRYSPKSQCQKGFKKADHEANREARGLVVSMPEPNRFEQNASRIAQLEAEIKALRGE